MSAGERNVGVTLGLTTSPSGCVESYVHAVLGSYKSKAFENNPHLNGTTSDQHYQLICYSPGFGDGGVGVLGISSDRG